MSALVDVCVLVAAHRIDHPHHQAAQRILDGEFAQGFAWCEHTRNGFLRLVTHPKLFEKPTPVALAEAAWKSWTDRPRSQRLLGSENADGTFFKLVKDLGIAGNDVYDWHLAALALTAKIGIVSFDRDFERVPGLFTRGMTPDGC